MIKAIIFDADGPLYYRAPQVTKQKETLLRKYSYSGEIKEFEQAYDQNKFKAYIREQTPIELFQAIFKKRGLAMSPTQAEQFTKRLDTIHQQVTIQPDAIPALKQLTESGYKICVLTDSFYSAEKKWPWFQSLGLAAYIDHIVSSYDIRRLKDTPEAYRACLDLLQTNADETIFVGHQPYEMAGARAAKIISVAVTPISPANIAADYQIVSLLELPTLIKKLDDIESTISIYNDGANIL